MSYEKHEKCHGLGILKRSVHSQLFDSVLGMGTMDQVQAPATMPTFLLLRAIRVWDCTQGPAEGKKTAEERK